MSAQRGFLTYWGVVCGYCLISHNVTLWPMCNFIGGMHVRHFFFMQYCTPHHHWVAKPTQRQRQLIIICPSPWGSVQTPVQKICETWPAGGTKWKVRVSPKSFTFMGICTRFHGNRSNSLALSAQSDFFLTVSQICICSCLLASFHWLCL